MDADEADDHRGIPRDGEGNPIFLILPSGLRTRYDEKLANCEKGWRATEDPAFVIEALILTHLHRQPSLLWVTEAACCLATKHRTKGYVTRALNAARRLLRYEAVRDAQRSGLTWEKAYERAAEVLAPTHAAGKPATMEADYKQVKQDLREGRSGLYAMPKMPNMALGDALSREPSPR